MTQKFTLIWNPKSSCSLKKKLGDIEKCESGVYMIKPELSSNLSGVVEGCKIHLLKSVAKPEVFVLSQNQYGKPKIKRDKAGKEIWQDHKYSDGRVVIYPEGHPEAGEIVKVPVFEKKPLASVIESDQNDLIAYINSLVGKI